MALCSLAFAVVSSLASSLVNPSMLTQGENSVNASKLSAKKTFAEWLEETQDLAIEMFRDSIDSEAEETDEYIALMKGHYIDGERPMIVAAAMVTVANLLGAELTGEDMEDDGEVECALDDTEDLDFSSTDMEKAARWMDRFIDKDNT